MKKGGFNMGQEDIEFYDVKTRQKVKVTLTDVTKTKYERKLKSGSTQARYAFRGKYAGRTLTKFCSEDTWKATAVTQEG